MHSPPITPWLKVERFEYERLEDRSALVQLLANLDVQLGAPAGAMLIVENGALRSAHMASCCDTFNRRRKGLLWRASFSVALDVVEYPEALFKLAAHDRVAIALPTPKLGRIDVRDATRTRLLGGARIRRHVVAIAAGLAIATASGSVVGVAAAGASGDQPAAPADTTATVPSGSTAPPSTPPEPATDTGATSTPTPAPPTSDATTPTSAPPTHDTTTPTPAPPTPDTTTPAPAPATSDTTSPTTPAPAAATPPPASNSSTAPAPGSASHATPAPKATDRPAAAHHLHRAQHGHHRHDSKPSHRHGTSHKPAHHDQSSSTTHVDQPAKHHRARPHKHQPAGHHVARSHEHGSPDHDVASAPEPQEPTVQSTPPAATQPVGPTTANAWTDALSPNPFTAGELSQLSSVLAWGDQPPPFLIPIYKAAARRYHVPWKILAAINSIETNYGRNLNVSSAGAIGWMQFMPATWRMYAVAADGRGQPNPFNPRDAIFSAARYLAANGARHNLRRAIFAYNHADWYVEAVLLKAQEISGLPFTQGPRAKLLPNGLAAAPAKAPAAVKAIIAAGNEIAGKPYVYGAAHGLPLLAIASAYDCSSSVEHLLYGARLLPVTDGASSASLESFGQPGPGRWVTIYASAGHVFIYVAGLRWDTHNAAGLGDGSAGIGWHPLVRSSDGFIARHPAGL
jgi:hypothetical protein